VYLLLGGLIETLPDPVNLWWPADRAWCVASEIDFNTTYVGGSAPCIADVLADPRIEAMATSAGAPIDATSDRVNRRAAQS
jgi:hypothetical protein